VSERRRIYRDSDGVRRTMIWDDEDPDKVVVHTEQDVEPILDAVVRDREIMANNGPNAFIGKVPVEVYERAVHQQWDESDWRRWWNGEGRAFRVWKPGAIL
jgi:hypothetical protein